MISSTSLFQNIKLTLMLRMLVSQEECSIWSVVLWCLCPSSDQPDGQNTQLQNITVWSNRKFIKGEVSWISLLLNLWIWVDFAQLDVWTDLESLIKQIHPWSFRCWPGKNRSQHFFMQMALKIKTTITETVQLYWIYWCSSSCFVN